MPTPPPTRRKHIHLHAARGAIRRSGEVCIVCAAAILRICLYSVIAAATAAEIACLEIPCALREAYGVEFVVNPVVEVEQMRDRRARVGDRRQGEIGREIKHTTHSAVRSRQVSCIVIIQIRVSIDVIAQRLLPAVIDPAIGGGRRVLRLCRHELAWHLGRLHA